ncbi:MAG: hypothetical protein HY344_01345 [Candidatus Levybacteria bacterium]|nr:hypothetical protein [Candidatus Levybacteria bacterium]
MNFIPTKRRFNRFIQGIKKLPHGKNHLDFITALLSIPVLLSVIILNYNNLQNAKQAPNPSPSVVPTVREKIILVPQESNASTSPSVTSGVCKKDIGPIEITSPKENETVTNNPVCVNIKYDDTNYCSVVWSYRVGNGNWSEFTSNNPCLYNFPDGNIKFELRVQSTVAQKEQTLTRNFTYKNADPQASGSATGQ